jgi:hypothetical protein
MTGPKKQTEPLMREGFTTSRMGVDGWLVQLRGGTDEYPLFMYDRPYELEWEDRRVSVVVRKTGCYFKELLPDEEGQP